MKPILFNTEMVRAILDGRKTVTRRVVKPQPTHPRRNCIGWLGWDDGHGYRMRQPYQVGDILYVRETWSLTYGKGYYYAADYDDSDILQADRGDISVSKNLVVWHPSIHMPKEAARIFLRVTEVRVERLQEIDGEAALKEGLLVGQGIDDMISLWNSTIKIADRDRYGWDANPWVWVIQFERIRKEEALHEQP